MFFMCPVCRDVLITFELEGVEIDRCLRCGGTWLDAGEFEMLATPSREGSARGAMSDALYKTRGERHGERSCVRCRKKLEIVRVNGVELDRCPRGHGLWFDKSELETVIASFKEGEEGKVARFLGDLTAAERKKGG
jgi:Zn-finger nucleic acid-binding protein